MLKANQKSFASPDPDPSPSRVRHGEKGRELPRSNQDKRAATGACGLGRSGVEGKGSSANSALLFHSASPPLPPDITTIAGSKAANAGAGDRGNHALTHLHLRPTPTAAERRGQARGRGLIVHPDSCPPRHEPPSTPAPILLLCHLHTRPRSSDWLPKAAHFKVQVVPRPCNLSPRKPG